MVGFPNWSRVYLKDVCISITDCVNKTAPVVAYKTEFKMIRTTNVKDGWIHLNEVKYVEKEIFDKWTRRNIPKKGDVILTREAPLGEVGMVKTDDKIFLGQRLVQYRSNPKYLDAHFLLYAFQEKDLQSQIRSLGSGATVEHMRVPDAEKMTLMLPPLPIQQKIAGILSAYDDLIENNTRRIAILEEMARMLYKEWFVDFRFPGHVNVKLVESSLGLIPEGWEVVKLSSLISTQYGYTESAQTVNVGPKYLRGMDINKNSYIEWDTVPYCPINSSDYQKYRLAKDDIVVIRMADPGKVGIVEKDVEAVFASYLIRLSIQNTILSPYYLFYFLMSDRYQDYISGASTGATRKSASAGVITDIEIVIPNSQIRESFEQYILNFRRAINNLLTKSANLRHTRDLLLPKLISGEIDVSSWVDDLPLDEVAEPTALVAAATSHTQRLEPSNQPIKPMDIEHLVRHSLWDE